MVTISMSFTDS